MFVQHSPHLGVELFTPPLLPSLSFTLHLLPLSHFHSHSISPSLTAPPLTISILSTLLLILRRRRCRRSLRKHILETGQTTQYQQPCRRPCHAQEFISVPGSYTRSIAVRVDQGDEFESEGCGDDRGDAYAE